MVRLLLSTTLALSLTLPLAAQTSPQAPAAPPASVPDEEEDTPGTDARSDIEEGFQQIEMLTRAMEIVRQNYVDPEKVTWRRLMASALRGMLEDLDPHSQFLSPELFQQMKQTQENTYEGVGITIAPKNNALVIVSVREDGPAARAGILPGDQILEVGDQLAEKIGYLETVTLLKGKPGEPLRLTIFRAGTGETIACEMVREVIRQETVRDVMLLDAARTGSAKIGYARLLQFNAPTARELADALDTLEDKGMQALVLDLRNNPGGLLNSAVDVCGEFLPPDTVVVTTEGREGAANPPPFRTPSRKRRPRDYPVVVLVNHSSASGAELLAGALQDLRRAVIVGTTTFGKGSVQSIIPGDGGTALRLTTARYYTPSHKTIHGTGIVPDIISTLTPDDEKRIFEFYRDHSLDSIDPAAFARLDDRQLDRAITALNGILIYQENLRKK